MNANTSDYTERLAQPRLHSQNNYRDAQWTISRHARRAQASNRVQVHHAFFYEGIYDTLFFLVPH